MSSSEISFEIHDMIDDIVQANSLLEQIFLRKIIFMYICLLDK